MSTIKDALCDAYQRLALPQPARTRVLLELSGDLEDMRRLYVEQGLSTGDAELKALESFDLSDAALAGLSAVHCQPLRRFLDRLSSQSRGILERCALAAVSLVAVWTLIRQGTDLRILREAGTFMWPVLAVFVAAVVTASAKLYQLYILQDHRLRHVQCRQHLPLALAGAGLALGFLGMYGHVFSAWTLNQGSPIDAIRHLAVAVQRSAALLTVAMGTAMVSASLWFASIQKIARVEESEAALALGLNDFPFDPPRSKAE